MNATTMTVGQQSLRIMRMAGTMYQRIGHVAVNHAAYELQKWAKAVIDKRSDTGLKIVESIKVNRSTTSSALARATVYVDGAKFPEAVWAHERYNDITVRPKVTMFLWVPLTAAGRNHVLHAHDSVQKRLKGWMVAGAKSRPVGYWPELESGMYAGQHTSDLIRGTQLDFILKRSVRIPAYKHAGYLTKTAERMRPALAADITATFNREITRSRMAA